SCGTTTDVEESIRESAQTRAIAVRRSGTAPVASLRFLKEGPGANIRTLRQRRRGVSVVMARPPLDMSKLPIAEGTNRRVCMHSLCSSSSDRLTYCFDPQRVPTLGSLARTPVVLREFRQYRLCGADARAHRAAHPKLRRERYLGGLRTRSSLPRRSR